MAIFLKLDGIDSDATDDKHKGWIACDSYTDGTSRHMSLQTGKGMQRETSSARLANVKLGMRLHKGSPKVMMASLLGDARKATIHVTRAGDASGLQNYLEVTLSNVFVTGYTIDCNGDVPYETITLDYTKIEKKYVPNGSDGKPGAPVPVGFDLMTAKKS
jgi:type VI secretion system secreted protein Hcp